MSKQNIDTIVGFLLDQSESMEVVRDETVSGFNEYLETLRGDDTPTFLTLWAFNSMEFDVIYDFEDVAAIPKMTRSVYEPAGLTPLYDSIAEGITSIESSLKARAEEWNVIFIIMTDGIENRSRYYNRETILDLIRQKEQAGWLFVYLGANQDAWAAAESIGIGKRHSAGYNAYNVEEALRTVADSTIRGKMGFRRMARPAQVDVFTAEERRKLFEDKKFDRRRS